MVLKLAMSASGSRSRKVLGWLRLVPLAYFCPAVVLDVRKAEAEL